MIGGHQEQQTFIQLIFAPEDRNILMILHTWEYESKADGLVAYKQHCENHFIKS